MKNILFIAYYFPPSAGAGVQRSLKYVKYLQEFGIKPVVISSDGIYGNIKDESLLDEIPLNTKIYYFSSFSILNLKKYFKNFILTKIIHFLNKLLIPDGLFFWYFFNMKKINRILKNEKIDLIYTTSSPYSAHLIALYLKKKNKKLKWIADFRDEWANNPEKFINKNKITINIIRNYFDKLLEKKIIKNSDKIISVSRYIENNFRNHYIQYKNKFETITNGYDEKDFTEISENKIIDNKFKILYYGSLYGSRHSFYFLEAFSRFIDNQNKIDKVKIKLKFIGNIDRYEDFKHFIDERNLNDNIEHQKYMDHNLLLNEANSSSLLLLLIANGKGQEGVFTGKIFEYIRLNVPILAMAPENGVAKELIKKTNTGSTVDFENVEEIYNELNNYFNNWKNGSLIKNYNKEKKWEIVKEFERRELSEKLSKIIENLISGKDNNE